MKNQSHEFTYACLRVLSAKAAATSKSPRTDVRRSLAEPRNTPVPFTKITKGFHRPNAEPTIHMNQRLTQVGTRARGPCYLSGISEAVLLAW